MDVSAVAPFTNVECPKCGKHTRVKREFGPYTLVRRHAVGGMSMVFVAHDNTLDREVALKILSEDFSADERRIAAFEEEARITASFSHPNVVRVLTTGYAFDRFYIAMELVPGGHFEHQIRERGKIPEIEMLPLAIEVAQGLKAAHAAGLIHRDVKPGNILLDAEGHAKLVDFGLALVTHGGKAQATELWATPYYVPPETVEGYEEDFRSDIYAFGASLYHALSGKPSCGEESMATDILREAKKRVVPLSAADPSLSSDTCRVVERAMAYDPNARFSSYDELIAALAVALSHIKSGRSESGISVAKRRALKKRRERTTMLSGVAVVAIAAGSLLWALNRKKPNPIVDQPPPVVPVPPPVVADTSAEIAQNYREARAAVEARDYEKAGNEFGVLHRDSAVQEPTRTWAGVEAVLVAFLDGRPTDGRKQARETLDHVQSLPENSNRIGRELIDTLDKLGGFKPLPVPANDSSSSGASHLIAAILAGLKDWEQGLLDPAVACFKAAAAVKLPPEDQWAAIYQSRAADYLADHAALTSAVFGKTPTSKSECEAATDELNTVLTTLKTRGRARFNVRAWQLDIARHAKLMGGADPVTPAPPTKQDPTSVELAEVLEKLGGFSKDCRFPEAVGYLKSLPEDPEGAKRASLLTVAESSVVFLADIEDDLAKEPVTADVQLKSGETLGRISMTDSGDITATTPAGQTKTYQWSDFSPDALISLHRLFVKNPKSELERLRRHECAIAYEWLAGSRERALAAAAVLAQESPAFKQRWASIASGLPK
jgi:eukaryotic-like serine/threonine-protein kinase